MLRYTVNSHNIGASYTPIIFSNCSLNEGNIFITSDCKLSNNDTLQLSRNINGEEAFVENTTIETVSDNGFQIKPFKDIEGYIDKFASFKMKKTPNGGESNFGLFIFKNNHCFVQNRNIISKENIEGDYSQFDENLRRCDNDFVTYENIFLYTAIVNNGKYVLLEDRIQNIHDVVLRLKGTCIEEYFRGKTSGLNWEFENNVLYLNKCIIPMDNSCHDDRKCILWEGDENTIHFIEQNWEKISVSYSDERFFIIKNDGILVQDGTKIAKKEGFIRINNIIEEGFSNGLYQESQNATLIHDVINGGKNGVIDYERKTFLPVYNGEKMVETLKFNLHFRKRSNTEEWKPIEGQDTTWYTPENGHSDKLIAHMNFERGDIEYRKKKLSKSFLRLSFYDSADRQTQSLITYSTIFFDTGRLYKNFMEKAEEDVESEIVCTNKYSTEASSEGFYLYLFPSLVENVKNNIIYMKAEFNHAKYGYIIPFVYFNGNPQRNSYLETETVIIEGKPEVRTFIDMNALNNDMYIPIIISENNGKYIWEIAGSTRNTVIDLYEPIVN